MDALKTKGLTGSVNKKSSAGSVMGDVSVNHYSVSVCLSLSSLLLVHFAD